MEPRTSGGRDALAPPVEVEGLVGVLRCPRCHRSVGVVDGALVCVGEDAHRFRLQSGVPVLLPEDREVVTMPVDHVSNAIGDDVLSWLESFSGYTLNLGAGATTVRPGRCVEVEYSVFRNTTVVADAHELPFEDATFDAAVSFNTFEHLADPAVAARELFRVLKPGAELRLQTAFLQPLHEEPAHYYNATEFGLRRWFSDFEILDCFVPPNMSPAAMFAWLANHVLYRMEEYLGAQARELVGELTLGQWSLFWSEPATRCGFIPAMFSRLPPGVQARFSAGLELRARKPAHALSARAAPERADSRRPGAAAASSNGLLAL
jgi:SAM-dependent methyltransferase